MRRRDKVYLWLRDHPFPVDVVLAVGMFLALGFVGWPVVTGQYVWGFGPQMWWPFGYGIARALDVAGPMLISAGLILPLAFRRVRPLWSGGLVFGTALFQWTVGVPLQASQVGVLVALHGLAAYGPRWASRAALVIGMVGAAMAGVRYVYPAQGAITLAVAIAALVLASWALGDLQRIRRQQLDALRERARRLEVEREQESRLAAADERARIAREMHDVVAHSLSVVIAQADGGRYAATGDPEAAVRACETISETGRAALTDMRRLLGVLRTDDGASRAPTPGLDDIDDLVAGVRDSGLPVQMTVTGTPRSVPSGVQLAAYRIVQEALTNVLKHAGPDASADVRLDWTPAGLLIAVTDDGRGAAADSALRGSGDGAGHGIPGMTERAALYGGQVQAGPVPGGGFSVRARLPYPARDRMQV